MAIKQRKQLTGTTEQINAYAGVEGQLVWDKTKKKWVGMSGTAGTNYPMASESHTHSISNVTNLQTTLDGKQVKGDYATSKALTDGLAGKANASHTHTIANVTGLQVALDGKQAKGSYATTTALTKGLAGKANTSHTHTVSQITDMPKVVLSVNDIKPDEQGDVALGLHAVATSGDYNDLTNKPNIPATPNAYVTKTWHRGTSWYRRWSDGFIEQGGKISNGDAWTWYTATLNTPFTTTSYTLVVGVNVTDGSSEATQEANGYLLGKKGTNTFRYRQLDDKANPTADWYACGY